MKDYLGPPKPKRDVTEGSVIPPTIIDL